MISLQFLVERPRLARVPSALSENQRRDVAVNNGQERVEPSARDFAQLVRERAGQDPCASGGGLNPCRPSSGKRASLPSRLSLRFIEKDAIDECAVGLAEVVTRDFPVRVNLR